MKRKMFSIVMVFAMALSLVACSKKTSNPSVSTGITDGTISDTSVVNDTNLDTETDSVIDSSETTGNSGEQEFRYKLAYLCPDTVHKTEYDWDNGGQETAKDELRQIFAMQIDPDETGEKNLAYSVKAYDKDGTELEVVRYSEGTSNAQVNPEYEVEGNLTVYGVVTDADPDTIRFEAEGDSMHEIKINAEKADIDLDQTVVRGHTIFELDGTFFQVADSTGWSRTPTSSQCITSFLPVGCDAEKGAEILKKHIDEMTMVSTKDDTKGQEVEIPNGLQKLVSVYPDEDGMQICVSYGMETADGSELTDAQDDQISAKCLDATLKIGDRVFYEY